MKLKRNNVYLTHVKQPLRAILANCSPSRYSIQQPKVASGQVSYNGSKSLAQPNTQRKALCRGAARLILALGSCCATDLPPQPAQSQAADAGIKSFNRSHHSTLFHSFQLAHN